jgi:hypothetical protein
MTKRSGSAGEPAEAYGDPLSAPFWAAADLEKLVLQQCRQCERWEHFPRPYCLACGSEDLNWNLVRGTGTVYSSTTVHMPIRDELEPPYAVGIVELDEGPRLLAGLSGLDVVIGDRVTVRWRHRPDGPPLPIFAREEASPA